MKNLKSFVKAATAKGVYILWGRDDDGKLAFWVNVSFHKGEKYCDYYREDGEIGPTEFKVEDLEKGACDPWHYLHLECPHHH